MTVEELLENFSLFEDWEDRYQYLIELGKKLPEMTEEYKVEANKVHGCTSQVWIYIKPTASEEFDFLSDSDSHIVRGLIAILHIIYAKQRYEDVVLYNIDDIFSKLGLQQHLSINRRNGFYAMVEKLQNAINMHKNTGQSVLK